MGIKKTIDEPEDLEHQLNELEKKLDRLRVMYEQHFLGIEKRPPFTLQHEVVRIIRDIGSYQIRKTALKFRYLSLTQRFNVHRAYWLRTLREIEEGTYRRDRLRAERREVARSGEALDAAELAKRALLAERKGEDAVEARRERTAHGDDVPAREAYVPAIARKKKRKKVSAAEIRGVSADALVERRDELEEAHQRVEAVLHPGRHNGGLAVAPPRSPFLAEVPRPEDSGLGEVAASTPVPGSPFRPQPSLAGTPAPPSGSPFRAPAATAPRPGPPAVGPPAPKPAGPSLGAPPPKSGPAASPFAEPPKPAAPGATPFRPHTPAPSQPARAEGPTSPFGGRPTATATQQPPPPRPTAQSGDAARQAARVLEHAGLPEERARQIYRDLVAARARFGKTASSLTYEHMLESMARQVPKLRESHGAQRVDFDVVTKDDKVFLKPKTR